MPLKMSPPAMLISQQPVTKLVIDLGAAVKASSVAVTEMQTSPSVTVT